MSEVLQMERGHEADTGAFLQMIGSGMPFLKLIYHCDVCNNSVNIGADDWIFTVRQKGQNKILCDHCSIDWLAEHRHDSNTLVFPGVTSAVVKRRREEA